MAGNLASNLVVFHLVNTAPTSVENLGSTNQAAQWLAGGVGEGQLGRRVEGTDRGAAIDITTGIDVSAPGSALILWLSHLWPGEIQETRNIEIGVGSNATYANNHDAWEVFKASDAAIRPYPPQAGYQPLAIDLDIAADSSPGSVDRSAIRNVGFWTDTGLVPGTAATIFFTKIRLLPGGGPAFDLTGGTVGSPASLQDFVDQDWALVAERSGIIVPIGGSTEIGWRVSIGVGGAVTFVSTDEDITWRDNRGLVSAGSNGLTIDLSSAGTSIEFVRGVTKSAGAEQGDLVVTGNAGTLTVTGRSLISQRVITLTDACTLQRCTIVTSGQISGHGSLTGSTVTGSTASSAMVWDTATDPDAALTGTTWESDGTGHAQEYGPNTPASITIRGQTFTDYAATDGSTGNEAILNNRGGLLTINVPPGDQVPSVMDGAGSSHVFVSNATQTFDGLQAGSVLVVYDLDSADPQELGTELFRVASTGTSEVYSYPAATNTVIVVAIRAGFKLYQREISLTGSDGTFTITQEPETN